jgi:hypothetical protein
MAFLDNSGDIILDAVLTDVGRMRMSQGDGSFRVNYFKLGDDEINYGLYNSAHTGGNAYYDLEIRQTPILESFSHNAASLKSTLISYTDPNLLYLPELLWNTNQNKTYGKNVRKFPYDPASTAIVLAATPAAAYAFGGTEGVLNGGFRNGKRDNHIRLEYGLNAPGKSPGSLKDREPELHETQFIVECDTRFCIPTTMRDTPFAHNFIDENMIGTYVITAAANSDVITEMTQFGSHEDPDQPEMRWLRGMMLRFKLQPSTLLQTGIPTETKSLWGKHGIQYGSTDWDTAASSIGSRETCGQSGQANNLATRAANGDLYHIDTNIRITARNTGARIDIPIVIVKSVNFVTSC